MTKIHPRRKVEGSTIVDGPEVPEDRDPEQREAEGPRSSMDYSEFPLLDFSHQKKTGAPASPHPFRATSNARVRGHDGVIWNGGKKRRNSQPGSTVAAR